MKTLYSLTVVSTLMLTPAIAVDDWAGQITASTERVEVGDVPRLNWAIDFPSQDVEELVEIEGDEVTAQKRVRADVRMIGAGWGTSNRFYQVEAWINDGSWSQLFKGRHQQVSSSQIVYSSVLEQGQSMNFAARGNFSYDSNNWGNYYYTWDNSVNIVVLKNGDDAPQVTPSYSIQASVEDYLAPYIDEETGKIVLGPRDLIFLFDFNEFGSSGYDLQDVCLITTFTEVE